MKPSAEDFEKWNEKHAVKHDLDKFYNHPNRIFRYIENKRIKTLIDFAEIGKDDEVLEIGCGAGHILERINDGRLTGLDISEIQIQRARKRLGHEVKLVKAPAEFLPFNDKHFDRIICTEVFEHVLEPARLLLEMKRALKDDGIISLSIPNENFIILTKKLLLNTGLRRILEPKESMWDLASKNNLEEWHIHKYGLKLIREQVKNDFIICKTAYIPFLFPAYRYVLQIKKAV